MMTHRLSIALIAVLFTTLSGCLTIETSISFDDRESGTIEMEYRIQEEHVIEERMDSPPGMLPLPVSEQEIRRAAVGIDQLELESYSTDNQDGVHVVQARLSFESLDALNKYYGAGDDTPAIYFEDGSYVQRVFEGFEEPIDDDSRSFLELAFSDSYLYFSVSLPEDIARVESGEQIGSREAQWRIGFEDVADEIDAMYWRIDM